MRPTQRSQDMAYVLSGKMMARHLDRVHLTGGYAPRFQAFSLAQASAAKMASFCPSRQQVTPAVETVEKVPFQKLIIEKWDRNIEKHLVFCVPHNILAIFKPNVGDFYEVFSIKGFFDSLVRQHY